MCSDELKLQGYVIDFAVVGDDIYVIELNPFGEGTGAAPFDWHNPEDRKTIFEGNTSAEKAKGQGRKAKGEGGQRRKKEGERGGGLRI